MLKRKSIGVVVCTYNGEKYLAEQLESILGQTRQPDKIFILDDRSKDRSVAIAEGFAKKDKRIRISVNESNLGYSRNFERGISLCDADFIALSDQDDIWFNNKLERLAAEFEANPGAGIAFCNAEYAIADGTRTGHLLFGKDFGPAYNLGQARRSLLEHGINIQGNLMLIDSEMKGLILPNPVLRSHGHDSWICLNAFFLRAPRYVPEPLSLYRIHPQQASGAGSFVLKGTPYQLKKKWYDHRRLARNLARIFTGPFKRPGILRERRLRALNYATDTSMVLKDLLRERKNLSLPPVTPEEESFFKELLGRWQAVIDSARNA